MRDFGPFRQAKCNKKEKREKRRRVRHKTTGELLLYYQNMCASVVRPPMYALKKQTLIMCCSIVDCPREQARKLQSVFDLRGATCIRRVRIVFESGERGELRERLRHRRVVVAQPVHRGDAHRWERNPNHFPVCVGKAFGSCVLRCQRLCGATHPLVRGQLSGGDDVCDLLRVVHATRGTALGTVRLVADRHLLGDAAVHEPLAAHLRPHRRAVDHAVGDDPARVLELLGEEGRGAPILNTSTRD
jgi:hypothetical protein